MHGAMWLMAGRAVFCSRRMFPQERPTFFGMAAVTGLVQGGALQQTIGREITVHFMTIRAGHLPLTNRMCRELHGLTANLRMTVKTDLGLGNGVENRIM